MRFVVSLSAEVPEPPGSDPVSQPPGTSPAEDPVADGRTIPDPQAPGPSFPDLAAVREVRDLLFARYVGPYRLTALLGEGGMGQVYLATQEQPLRREVALKVIKRGMDTDAIVARFASERRALALMDHPSIARVLDAGTTDDGRPFVAMELVRGQRLTDYCDGAQLTVDERLRLFLDVLRGVQHAHQKGVLHRDLKPSNILVTTVDGRPQPKIIDFGIAKALTDDEPLATRVTMLGQFIGTPEYMSPEQAGVIPVGVDTRSDVYSLGVVLFELLTGHRPYDFDKRTPTAVSARLTDLRLPMRPSAAVTTRTSNRQTDSTQVDLAAARRSSPARLRRTLRGDLDTIVLKAMHPEPDRRYGSVEQFADDLDRYLRGLPVNARPDSRLYRASRFVRRHAVGVALALLAVCALVAFVVALARERARAVEAERVARVEAATATQVSRFLVDLFDEANPATNRGREVTARELVDRGAERIRTEVTDAPIVRGQLLHTLGDVYLALGRPESAELLLRDALAVREAAAGPDAIPVAETLNTLGRVLVERGATAEALALYERALAIREAAEGEASDGVSEVLNNLGLVHLTDGRPREAADALRRSMEIRRGLGEEARAHRGGTLFNLAVAHYQLGEYEQADEVLTEAEPLLRAQYGTDGPHPNLVGFASFRGLILRELKRLDEARAVLEAGVADARKLYPEPHGQLGTILNNLALVERAQRNYARAEALYREVLAIDLAIHKGDHPDVAHSYFNLGTFLYERGQREEGTRLLEQALDMRMRVLGSEHPMTALAMSRLADHRADAGRLREAIDLYERAEAIQAAVLPEDHKELRNTRTGLEQARARLR